MKRLSSNLRAVRLAPPELPRSAKISEPTAPAAPRYRLWELP